MEFGSTVQIAWVVVVVVILVAVLYFKRNRPPHS
jgi:hypothetical protein